MTGRGAFGIYREGSKFTENRGVGQLMKSKLVMLIQALLTKPYQTQNQTQNQERVSGGY